MAKKKKKAEPPLKPQLMQTHLGALTRVEWTGVVLAEPGIQPDDLTDPMYDAVDAGYFTDDMEFWEKGDSCETQPAEDVYAAGEIPRPTHVAVRSAHGRVEITALPDDEPDPAAFLEKFKKIVRDQDEEGETDDGT